jgi:hypothetical protein
MDPESLYRIREDFRLNHELFAERLGVTREELIGWEMGTEPIPNRFAMKLWAASSGRSTNKQDVAGWFYVIQLIPDLKPDRLKFGFSQNFTNRLNGHRVSSPTACVLKTYPCVWADEIPCIASVVNQNCHRLTAEAYDVDSIDRVIAACDRYFEWVTAEFEPDEYAQLLRSAQNSGASMERFVDRLERIKEDWRDLH